MINKCSFHVRPPHLRLEKISANQELGDTYAGFAFEELRDKNPRQCTLRTVVGCTTWLKATVLIIITYHLSHSEGELCLK